jgi:PhzF family phenazine biosynthesis protein
MNVELHLVDSFCEQPFQGNPAAVCVLGREESASWMQAVAGETGASETAFLLPRPGGWSLRWFAPSIEVDLCGHGTLAAAFTLWRTGREQPGSELVFDTRSGLLSAKQQDDWILLDFPAEPAVPLPCPDGLSESLGAKPVFVGKNRLDVLVKVGSADVVRALEPDMSALAKIPARGVIVTARSDQPGYDFVSRFFAPAIGVPEDPVTGSAHCCLGPYWGEKLGKTTMTGYQCSARGGSVRVTLGDGRVILGGKAVAVFSGNLLV